MDPVAVHDRRCGPASMITVAGLVSPAAATAAGRSPSLARTARWDGRLASATHADAAAGSAPSLIRRATMAGRERMPQRMTRFVPERLRADQAIRLARAPAARCPDTTPKPAAPAVLGSGRPAGTGAAGGR